MNGMINIITKNERTTNEINKNESQQTKRRTKRRTKTNEIKRISLIMSKKCCYLKRQIKNGTG